MNELYIYIDIDIYMYTHIYTHMYALNEGFCVQNRALTRVSQEALDAQVTPASHIASTTRDTETRGTGSVIGILRLDTHGVLVGKLRCWRA